MTTPPEAFASETLLYSIDGSPISITAHGTNRETRMLRRQAVRSMACLWGSAGGRIAGGLS